MKLRVLSLGAGVQSSALALLAANGEIEPPHCAIFADTGWEPASIYAHLDWLETQMSWPLMRVQKGNLRDDILAGDGRRLAAVPWFMKKWVPARTVIYEYDRWRDGGELEREEIELPGHWEQGMGRRQCTKEYKIDPLQRAVRWLLGGSTPKGGCEMLIGISTDEASRMRPSRVGYIVNSYPLIDLRMSRNDCLAWMEKRGYPKPGKSSCLGCPFHSDNEWRAIRRNPEEWADTVAVDAAIRRQPKIHAEQFMHRSCLPLDQVDFSTAEERGQINMFENDCDGMCGV